MKRTKSFLLLLISVVFIFTCVIQAFAHSGKTDSAGGHYNSRTGEYHYHHGYPAHYHTNGICPYDFDNKTGEQSGSGSSSNTKRYFTYSSTPKTFEINQETLEPIYSEDLYFQTDIIVFIVIVLSAISLIRLIWGFWC